MTGLDHGSSPPPPEGRRNVRDFDVVGESPERLSLAIVLGESSRFFAGHFPGHPILPAVAHLVLVDELLRRTFGQTSHIVSIERLRMLQPVLPGDRIEIRLIPGDDDADAPLRFSIDRGAERLSEGLLSWARAEQ